MMRILPAIASPFLHPGASLGMTSPLLCSATRDGDEFIGAGGQSTHVAPGMQDPASQARWRRTAAILNRHLGSIPSFDPENGTYRPDFLAVEKEAVAAFVIDLLQDPDVIAAARTPGNVVNEIIKNLSWAPLFLHIPPVDPIERTNFTSYLRVHSLRTHEYENPLMADLYMLHEFSHMTLMPYGIYPLTADWANKVIHNEKVAACNSEAYFHFVMPGIRSRLGIHTIWVDRYLNDDVRLDPGCENHEFYRADPRRFFARLLEAFLAIDRIPEDLRDATETRTGLYSMANNLWCEIYHPCAEAIETQMIEFNRKNKQGDPDIIQWHLRWLREHATNGMLFAEQAIAFRKASDELNARYGRGDRPLVDRLQNYADFLSARAAEGQVTRTDLVDPSERLIRRAGIVPTVYALPFPETARIAWEVEQSLSSAYLYAYPYLRRQDTMHDSLIAAFREFARPIVQGLDGYPYAYASNGSSESIEKAFTTLLKVKNPDAHLHVFEAEYEGAGVIANNLQIGNEPLEQPGGRTDWVRRYPRTDEGIERLIRQARPGDFVYLSQPSAIDGNVWDGYDAFMQATENAGLKMMIDLCYVGSVAREFSVNVTYSHIAALFWAPSKPLGMYYKRIGGSFFRDEVPLLYANKWFKAVSAQLVGAALYRRFDAYALPRKYKPLQEKAIEWVNEHAGLALQASDVILLGHQWVHGGSNSIDDEDVRFLYRGGSDHGVLRACLTPWLEASIRLPGHFQSLLRQNYPEQM